MPFLISKVNIPVNPEQERELKARLGRAIELVPGKSEESLFLSVEDQCRLWLRGENSRPMGYLTVSIFGNENHAGYREFSEAVTDIYRDLFMIAPEDFYIKFDDITAWSVGGQYIDRRMFR